MDYSSLYVRSSDQHLVSSVEHTNLTGDFTIEFWWKPASLTAGQDQTFYQVSHSSGGTPVRLWKTDAAGVNKLRLRCQEVGGAAPLATEHVEIEWDINALVSASTWVHVAVAFDVSNPVATIAELYTDAVSRGNGTVISGTDCSSIIVGDANQYIGSDGAGVAVDGQLFDWRMWLIEVRTSTEISDNYQLVPTNSSQANLRESFYKGGQHHENSSYGPNTTSLFSVVNGPIGFVADIPANINQSVGTVDGDQNYGVVEQGVYGSLAWSGESADINLLVGDGQDFLSYSSDSWSGELANLVDLSGTTSAPAFVYRMRAYDAGLARDVYWTAEDIDAVGASYVGPGPLSDVVVSNVICQR